MSRSTFYFAAVIKLKNPTTKVQEIGNIKENVETNTV